jgi:hypothetical protein
MFSLEPGEVAPEVAEKLTTSDRDPTHLENDIKKGHTKLDKIDPIDPKLHHIGLPSVKPANPPPKKKEIKHLAEENMGKNGDSL